MNTREASAGAVMSELWRMMDSQEWDSLSRVLDPDLRVEYVHTGELFGRDAYIALNRDYPGTWRTEIVELVADASHAAARVRVTDGSETHCVASFGTVEVVSSRSWSRYGPRAAWRCPQTAVRTSRDQWAGHDFERAMTSIADDIVCDAPAPPGERASLRAPKRGSLTAWARL